MERTQIIAQWLPLIDALEVSVGDSPGETGERNRISFSFEQAKTMGASVDDVAEFLEQAFGRYSRAAARIGLRGWFYAWCDEMAGTFNCSACDVGGPDDLPFACRLDVRADARAIAEIAIGSPYAAGIPSAELKEVEWTDPESEPTTFALVVFAKPLVPREAIVGFVK